eukprot:2711258-Pyramimonas_sp.AAC.1
MGARWVYMLPGGCTDGCQVGTCCQVGAQMGARWVHVARWVHGWVPSGYMSPGGRTDDVRRPAWLWRVNVRASRDGAGGSSLLCYSAVLLR